MSETGTGEPFETAARYANEADAIQAVETLTVRGVGAMWKAADGDFAVLVVPGQAGKAREILGIGGPEDWQEPVKGNRRAQLLWVLLIFGLAMIILPALAFFLSFKLAGG